MDRAARAMFELKWPTVQRVVRFHAKRLRIRGHDREDLLQIAGLKLWRACPRAVREGFQIDAQVVGMAAFSTWKWQRRNLAAYAVGYGGAPGGDTAGELEDPIAALPAPADGFRLPCGVTLTLTDLELDSPELVETYARGITAGDAARRLGVSRQRVYQIAERLGAVRDADGRYKFPADTGLTRGSPRG